MEPEDRIGESERWMSALVGGMLVLSSLRRRDAASGALFATAGSALIFRGIVGHDGVFGAARDMLRDAWGAGRYPPPYAEDEVDEASMESFPASDAPSWTTTTGSEE